MAAEGAGEGAEKGAVPAGESLRNEVNEGGRKGRDGDEQCATGKGGTTGQGILNE